VQQRFLDGAEVDQWLLSLRDALSALPGFVGLWIHGSGSQSGEWIACVSDVDLIVGWDGRPSPVHLEQLREELRQALVTNPYQNADVHVVTSAIAAAPPARPRYELYGAIHGIDDPEPVLTGPAEDTQLLFDLESARTSGLSIIGPSGSDFFGQVPTEWLLEAADRELAEWESYSTFHQPHMAVLQAARAWMLAVERQMEPKLTAGRWARSRWSEPETLDIAMARQRGDSSAVVSQSAARSLLAHARDHVFEALRFQGSR
jgi:aminoglycoside adenylyltransferase-like protein